MPTFQCDLQGKSRRFRPFWKHSVGSGHAPLLLRADAQEQLHRCHRELGFQHVRYHGFLSEPMGTLVEHGGQPLFSFFNSDRIWDFLLSIGMRPFVELSFMPRMLASGDETVFHYAANVTPPKNLAGWRDLVQQVVRHAIDRYGAEEVRLWPFEVWNEPNLDSFWKGDAEDYFQLYETTVRAIKDIEPDIRVGGPASAQGEWIETFLEACERRGVPADFVSTHAYPTDALGEEDDDTLTKLAKGDRDVLVERARAARERAGDKPLYFTEWNVTSNPRDSLHDGPFTAAYVTRTLLSFPAIVDGYSYWTFSDIFEENYFPSRPFHGGFGLLDLYGIPKPAYRAFEILARLGERRWVVEGEHETVDVFVFGEQARITIVLTNLNLPHHPIEREDVRLELRNVVGAAHGWVERIDDEHGNPLRIWETLGRPTSLSARHVEQLRDASTLSPIPLEFEREEGSLSCSLSLPAQSVAAITIETDPRAGEKDA